MPAHNNDKSKRDQHLDEVVTAYLKDVETGRAPNQADWLARYPDLAADLAVFFAAQDQVAHLAAPLRAAPPSAAADAPTTGLSPNAAAVPGVGMHIQYFGDYELLQEIGRGGMGVVYKARQVSLNRVVALKMILTGQLANDDDVKRFRAEAEAAAKLQHDGIVPVFEVGKYEGHHYFTMAFVEGESLAHKLTEGMLSPRHAAELTKKVAKAVSYAHTEGVIHRDLKPANILLDKHGEPRLTDFGLAKRLTGEPGALATGAATGGLTATGQILGTPSYMPPEQASGRKGAVGPLADVYSLGAILYCLLTARPPFQADNPFDTLMQVVEQEPVPPRQLNAKVPRDLETICLKCLQKEPTKRYLAACGLAEDLDRFLLGQPIQARPTGRLERGWKWAKRRPAAAVLTMVLACAWIPPLVTGMIFVDETNRARLEAIQSNHSYDLATQSANNALERAEQQRKEAHAANVKARVAHEEAEAANAKAKASLTRADGLRLIYESETTRAQNPGLALLLALEGAKRHPGLLANNTLQVAMDECFELRVLEGHGKPVYLAKLNADGSKALTCGKDGTVRIWDALTGRQLHVLHEPKVAKAWFSPDGRRVLTLSLIYDYHHQLGTGSYYLNAEEWKKQGPVARLWDAATGKVIAHWQPPHGKPAPPRSAIPFVYAVDAAFSADSRRVVTSFGLLGDGACEVRDLETGAPAAVLKGHNSPVVAVAFSPDKRTIATACTGETAYVWDAETGKLMHELKGHKGMVGAAVFNADGKRLLTLTTGTYLDALLGGGGGARDDFAGRIWDTQTGKLITGLKWPDGNTNAFQTGEIVGDEGILLASTQAAPAVWNAVTGEPITTTDRPGPSDFAASVQISPATPKYILVAGPDRTARLKAGGSNDVIFRGHDDDVLDAGFGGDGRRLITASKDGTARVWQTANPLFATSAGPDSWATTLTALSPDGRRLFVSPYGAPHDLLLGTGTRQTIARIDSVARQVVYTPDSQKLLVIRRTGYDFNSPWLAQLLDAATGKLLATMNDLQGRFLALSPDSRFILLASWKPKVSYAEDGPATVWELSTGKKVADLIGHTDRIEHFSFCPDSRRVLTTSNGEGDTRIWHAATGKQLWQVERNQSSLRWSDFAAGQQVVSLIDRGPAVVRIVDAETGKEKHKLTAATVAKGTSAYGMTLHLRTFSPDRRRVLLATYEDVPCIWDIDKPGEPTVILRGHTERVSFAEFSGDGRHVLTASHDRTARLWDAATGRELMVFKGHENKVEQAALDATGARLVTSSADKTVRIWDTRTGEELARVRTQSEAYARDRNKLAFTPDAKRVVIHSGNSVRLWPVDVVAAAGERKPRELTAAERKRYGLD